MLRRGALPGLALLLALPCGADESLRDAVRKNMGGTSYVLIEDQAGARLFVLPAGDDSYSTIFPADLPSSVTGALTMTQSADVRTRVRGLTLLAGEPGAEALNAALVLLSDPDEAVREEAVNLIIDHPHGDIDTVVAIALRDPSLRVREAVEDSADDDDEDEEY